MIVQFFVKNKWTPVVIDTRIPTIDKIPAFGRGGNPRNMCIPLVEKAYAKLKGSY